MNPTENNNDDEETEETKDQEPFELEDSLFLFPNLPPDLLSMPIGIFLEKICNKKGPEIAKEIASLFDGKHWSYLTERFFSENDVLEMYKIIHEITLEYQVVLTERGALFMESVAQSVKELKGITSLSKLLNSTPSINFEKIAVANSTLLDIQTFLEQILEERDKEANEVEIEAKKQDELKKISNNLAKIEQHIIKIKTKLIEKEKQNAEKSTVEVKKDKIKKRKKKKDVEPEAKSDNNDSNLEIKALEQYMSDLVDARFDLNTIVEKRLDKLKSKQDEYTLLSLILGSVRIVRETLESNRDSYTENSEAYKQLEYALKGLSKKLAELFENIVQKNVEIEKNKTLLQEIHEKKKDVIIKLAKAGANMNMAGNINDVPQYLEQLNSTENNLINLTKNPNFQPKINPFKRNKNLDQEVDDS